MSIKSTTKLLLLTWYVDGDFFSPPLSDVACQCPTLYHNDQTNM